MREIESIVAAAVSGGADATKVTPLFAALLPAFEYLPVMPPLPFDGFGEV
jgi:hypothetical protein